MPLLLAESQSEKLVARVRFSLASVCAFLSLYLFAANNIDFIICAIQIGLLLFVCVYSGIFLFEPRNKPIRKYIAYITTFFDVIIVTGYIWTLHIAGFSAQLIHITAFPAYFVIIGFTALHNRYTLSFFAGFFSIYAYFSLYLITFSSDNTETNNLLIQYAPGLIILLVATFLSMLSARNNYSSVEKIASFEGGLSNLGGTLPLMLFKIDKKGKFLWVNTLSPGQFGVSSKKLLGQNIHTYIVDLEELKSDKLPIHGTFKVKNFGRDIKYVDCIIQAENEKCELLDGSIVDVSDRERAISQREEMEQRLFQYQKMESLGTLASGMAHDFNNILQTVTDITDRVANKTSESDTKRGMALIAETLTDARFLISELLALGRKKPLNYGPVNIATFLREVIPTFSEQLGDSYEVNCDIRDEDLWIQGDADYFKRILQNLFGNAKDAMPEGGIITLECFRTGNEGEESSVVIRCSDTGVGVPESIIEKIFDPFYTTKKKGKGTGLGLALVRRIVTQHKGVVYIEKSNQQGTTFRIELPETEEYRHDLDTKTILINRISTTVLVLDDDPKMCNILNFFLTDLSYKTCISSTMEDGLKGLKKHLDDCKVLIMDWKLKEKDPHEVIKRFRALKPELIIIVVSGYQPLQDSIKKMNIFRWITKPYDKNRLDHEIQKALYLANKDKK